MGKIFYVLLIIIFLIGTLMLIPNSPIYPLAANFIQKKVESRWNFKVIGKRISANPFSGILSIRDLSIKTPEAVNPTWSLQVKSATLEINYLSLIRNATIDKLAIDGIFFKQKHRETAAASSKKASTEAVKHQKPELGTPQQNNESTPKKLRIKRLVIHNGSFEYSRIDPFGMKKSTKADRISIVLQNVHLDKRPDLFFRSILKPDTKILP